MNKSPGLVSAIVLVAASPCLAAKAHSAERLLEALNADWYGRISAAGLRTRGDVGFYGTSASAYGGTPALAMADGRSTALAVGIRMNSGWRLDASIEYVTVHSNAAEMPGLDDRTEDLFSVDATIESLCLMLNAGFDFDIGSPRFTPYLKGGIGVARNVSTKVLLDIQYDSPIWDNSTLEGVRLDDYAFPEGRSSELAWQIGVGMRMRLTTRIDALLEFGQLVLGDAQTDIDGNGDAIGFDEVSNRHVTVGLEYRF